MNPKIIFRKKNESLNYLRMSSKVDATASRYKTTVNTGTGTFQLSKSNPLFCKLTV